MIQEDDDLLHDIPAALLAWPRFRATPPAISNHFLRRLCWAGWPPQLEAASYCDDGHAPAFGPQLEVFPSRPMPLRCRGGVMASHHGFMLTGYALVMRRFTLLTSRVNERRLRDASAAIYRCRVLKRAATRRRPHAMAQLPRRLRCMTRWLLII